jgi:stearoyl-CoA desaturase (delta-9 desaturase)
MEQLVEADPRSRADPAGGETRRVDFILAVIVTFAPPIAAAVAGWLWWRGTLVPGPLEFGLLVGMHLLCLMGVELGFHRLFTHRSYKASRGLKIMLASFGSMAFQGPVIWWSSIHRKHHRYSDQPGDPHSMYLSNPEGKWTLRGGIHAHVGWVWSGRNVGKGGFAKYARDLYLDRDVFWIQMNYLYFLLGGFLVPGVIAGLVHGSWLGFAGGVLWGGFVRIFVMNHLTYWCINSVTHGVGHRSYQTRDRSTNVPLLSIVTLGQSWHNNHHACPAAAVMNHTRWQVDPGAWFLYLFRGLGMVRDMRMPSEEIQARKRLGAAVETDADPQ